MKADIVIIGAGPTGLGAATRLNQLGKEDWLLLDAFQEAGGLACTDVTSEGFLFDMVVTSSSLITTTSISLLMLPWVRVKSTGTRWSACRM